MWTFRSRGSDISAIAPRSGSSRMRIIVSDRLPEPSSASRALLARLSEPISRIVCGLPGAASASLRPVRSPVNARAIRSTWLKPTTMAVAAAVTILSAPPIRKRFQIEFLSGRSGNAQVRCGAEPLRDRVDEVDERLAVLGQRGDRDPLLRAVVTAAAWAELDPRHAGVEEADDVRGAVAADRDRLAAAGAHGLGERDDVRVVAVHDGR